MLIIIWTTSDCKISHSESLFNSGTIFVEQPNSVAVFPCPVFSHAALEYNTPLGILRLFLVRVVADRG